MIRINLLPPEIIEKRRDEKRWRWVIAGGLVVLVLLVGFYLVMFYLVSVKTADVAQVEQEAQNKQAQAEQVKIFQVKQDELSKRENIVKSALAGRVAWDQLFYEISLVLPTDIWLQSLQCSEDDPLVSEDNESGIQLNGFALDSQYDTPDGGYKSVAKLMVRLAELSQLQRVWLSSAAKTEALAGAAEPDTQSDPLIKLDPPIAFSINAQTPKTVMKSNTATGSPAPPTTP